jgi:D-alanyl-D-alanine carboxypeptidase
VNNSKLISFALWLLLLFSANSMARMAAIVIDADSGRVIHENEASQRWYPASLTKVMTIYLTFSALEAGKLSLHELVTVSKNASMQPHSKLGLHHRETLTVEQAILAVTTRSANDAAVVLAERLGGTESHFASMMTQQAQRLGMTNSSFQNASGLPDEGQISCARDLAILSAALIHDFPQYYPYFSATEFTYRGRTMPNTNRILRSYPDADGMKTGFTCGSGYNLIASARRNGHRLIGVVLGAHSSAERFEQMGDLLNAGFEKSMAGSSGVHVSQLRDDDNEPPPFQLSSNRCAGSAEQMSGEASPKPQFAALTSHHAPAKNHHVPGRHTAVLLPKRRLHAAPPAPSALKSVKMSTHGKAVKAPAAVRTVAPPPHAAMINAKKSAISTVRPHKTAAGSANKSACVPSHAPSGACHAPAIKAQPSAGKRSAAKSVPQSKRHHP